MLFKINYRYYLCISYKKDFDPNLKSKTANKFSPNSKTWLLYANKIFTMLKNSKNNLTVKKFSLKAIY